MKNTQVQKKTFNIDLRNIKNMESFIALGKQTTFVNKAVRRSLDQMKEEKQKQEAIESLEKFYSMRVKSDKSTVELLREARHERVDRLIAEREENEK